MHTHRCSKELPNQQRCGEVVAICSDDSCKDDAAAHFCPIHHPDPQHHIEPTPPLKK